MATIRHKERSVGGHPYLLAAFPTIEALQDDLVVVITSGGRTDADQAALFAKGRTTTGEPPFTGDQPWGQIVTNAPTTQDSAHGWREFSNGLVQFCALDIMALVDGEYIREDAAPEKIARRNALQKLWQDAVRAAHSATLELGADWTGQLKDGPHVQVKGWRRIGVHTTGPGLFSDVVAGHSS